MALPLIPLLGLGASLLGNIFGNSESQNQSQNQSSSGTSNSHTASATQQNSDTATTATSNTNQTQNTTQNSTNNTKQTTVGNQAGTGSLLSKSGTDVSRLDAGTLASLTENVQRMLSTSRSNSNTTQEQIGKVAGGADFDVNAFVKGISDQARADASSGLESSVNSIRAGAGGTSNSNSMVALLENKMKGQTAANLAGITSSATQAGTQMQQQGSQSKTSQLATLTQGSDSNLANLLGSLLNANESQSTTEKQDQSSTQKTSDSTLVDVIGAITGNANSTSNTVEAGTQKSDVKAATQSDTSGSQTSNGTTTASGNTTKNNWSDFFNGLGGVFKTQF